jgi:hypothetical protein
LRSNPYRNRLDTSQSNSFLDYVGHGHKGKRIHSLRIHGFLPCCLEQDYVGDGKLTKLLCATTTKNKDSGEASATTSWDLAHASVANACVNKLAVGASTLLGREAQGRERAVQRVRGPRLA